MSAESPCGVESVGGSGLSGLVARHTTPSTREGNPNNKEEQDARSPVG